VDKNKQPGIQIGQIFLERAEFSHREDALQLPASTLFQPNLEVKFQGGLAPDKKAGFLRAIVRTKPDDQPLYNFSVTLLAIFKAVEGQENLPLKDYIRTTAPAMLYPFIRETVASITGRGHFGPLWMNPFNLVAGIADAGEQPKPPTKTRKKRSRAKAKT
jgi:preprotein translocase subunit SecB